MQIEVQLYEQWDETIDPNDFLDVLVEIEGEAEAEVVDDGWTLVLLVEGDDEVNEERLLQAAEDMVWNHDLATS